MLGFYGARPWLRDLSESKKAIAPATGQSPDIWKAFKRAILTVQRIVRVSPEP